MARWQGLPWAVVALDIQQASPRIFMPNDVPPCCYYWQEQTQLCYPLGWAGALSRMRLDGRTNCNGAHLTWFLLWEHCRSLPHVHQGRYAVMRRWRHVFPRRPWTLSKNTSDISSLLHQWVQNCIRSQLMSLGSTPNLNSTPGTTPLMKGSWALSETPAKKLWPWQEIPTDGHWWPQHFWRTK